MKKGVNSQYDQYVKLAKNGDVNAQKFIGVLLCIDTEQSNPTEGIHWLKKAAGQNDSEAMYLLGKIYFTKIKNEKEAYIWYRKAAESGSVVGLLETAACLFFGIGTVKKQQESILLYKQAAEAGVAAAYHNLGYIFSFCKDIQPDYLVAIQYFNSAVTLKYAESAYVLGVIYLLGKGVPVDVDKALEQFEKAFALGKTETCQILGNLYLQGKFGTPEFSKAQDWYFRGMESGVASCAETLGYLYSESQFTQPDYSLAYDFFVRAAEMNSADGAFMAAAHLVQGLGVSSNFSLARQYLIRAIKLGHKKADKYLHMLNEIDGGGGAVAGVAASSVGINLSSSFSESAEEINMRYDAEQAKKRKESRSIFVSAGAQSGSGSFEDYDMGAVIGPDGEITYVDAESGIILGSDGSVSSHDCNTGMTYNWKTGGLMSYDETFDAAMNFDSGKVHFNINGYTV